MKFVFVGYMASGKSIVANVLSDALGVLHIDLDAYIEFKEKKSITEIFESKGEIYFRLIESSYLRELLSSNKKFILSVGGGTPCYANNMELIEKLATSFYLKASISTIYERLLSEKAKRPLVSNISNSDLKEFIAKHLFERNPFYNLANYTIVVDDKSVDDIVAEINLLQISD